MTPGTNEFYELGPKKRLERGSASCSLSGFGRSRAHSRRISTFELAETQFKTADPNNDGTLNAKELESKAGQDLLKLLQ